eukprot:1616016-Pleurochrysis_carterae.AAC.3
MGAIAVVRGQIAAPTTPTHALAFPVFRAGSGQAHQLALVAPHRRHRDGGALAARRISRMPPIRFDGLGAAKLCRSEAELDELKLGKMLRGPGYTQILQTASIRDVAICIRGFGPRRY